MVAWTPAPPRTSFASLSEHFAAESDGEGGKLGQEDAVKEVSDANNNVDSDRQEFCQQMLDQDQDPRAGLIDELKLVQEVLDLKTRADIDIYKAEEGDIATKMDLMPKSYQILRQYPILSNRETVNDNDDPGDVSDGASECLENRSEFVRNGFGRLSAVSGKSLGPGAENYNSVDEITIYGNITRKPPSR